MTEERERLIRGTLRTNESFLRDLRRLFDTPSELLKAISGRTKAFPYVTLSDTEAEELASRFGGQAEDLQHIAALLLFLKQRLVETDEEPMRAIVESRNLLDREDLAKGREDEIAGILSSSREEREEALAIGAFSGSPTFLSTTARPCLLPITPSSTELVGGYLWTIFYLDAEGEQKSITVGLTPGELEQLEVTMNRAKEQLRTIKGRTNSAQTE